jgi:N-acyl-D-amino-acid deacylase
VIEAGGLVTAPGFIDTHSHADGGLLENPDAETQIRQGITTAIVGQDGGSRLPLAGFFADLQRTPAALNIASFVGHGTLRRQVLGDDFKRAATSLEVIRMRAIAAQEMRAGAVGLSSGLEYDPGLYATTEEVIAVARVAALNNGLYISHVRDEENEALASFDEVIRIAREAGLPAQISHIKLGSSPVWNKAGDTLGRIEHANRRGLDISADVYPYTYWQSRITVLIPHRNWDDRPSWERGLAEIGGAKNVLLTAYSPDPAWQNKTIAQIAQTSGKRPGKRDSGDRRPNARAERRAKRERKRDRHGHAGVRPEALHRPSTCDVLLGRRPECQPSAQCGHVPARSGPLRARAARCATRRGRPQDDLAPGPAHGPRLTEG